uniref:Serpentine receptor class gamma n=1 Tax=Steinernema glaseri TaxID=37863 RepID=A0A1I8ADN7_9BILA
MAATGNSTAPDLTLFQVTGAVFTITTTFSCLLQLRTFWVLITKSIYRNSECFRLLMHISLSQMLMYPGFVLISISRVFSFDPWVPTINLLISSSRTEVILSFVLALNRLKIIASFKYPQPVHTVISITSSNAQSKILKSKELRVIRHPHEHLVN